MSFEIEKMDLPDDLDPSVAEYVSKLEDAVVDLADAVEAAEVETDEPETVDVADVEKADLGVLLKSADPAVRAIIIKQQEAIEAAAVRVTQAEEIAKAERAARIDREVRDEAERLSHLGKAEDVAEVLKALRETGDADLSEQVVKMLASANKVADESHVFDEIGKVGAPLTGPQAEAGIVASIRAADPSLSESQAVAKAYIDNPSLYTEYLTEKGA